jgi:hypothetical protein
MLKKPPIGNFFFSGANRANEKSGIFRTIRSTRGRWQGAEDTSF